MKKKTTPNSLEKKIKAYSMAAVAAMAAQPATAAVVYTDIDPDTTFTGVNGDYLLDLNGDGVDDFNLQFTVGSASRSVRIYPSVGNEVLGSGNSSFFYPFALSLNDPISAAQSAWNGTANGGYLTLAWLYTTGGSYGNWFGASDKYLGLRFQVGGNWHYGWCRLDIDATCTYMTVKDYAYDSSPNTAIAAGNQGQVGMNKHLLPAEIDIFAFDRILTVDLKDVALNNANLSLISINGQEVLNSAITGNRMQFALGELKKGLYLATLRSEKGILTRKIYID